jgi:hypothetical protein
MAISGLFFKILAFLSPALIMGLVYHRAGKKSKFRGRKPLPNEYIIMSENGRY